MNNPNTPADRGPAERREKGRDDWWFQGSVSHTPVAVRLMLVFSNDVKKILMNCGGKRRERKFKKLEMK